MVGLPVGESQCKERRKGALWGMNANSNEQQSASAYPFRHRLKTVPINEHVRI